jgi:hypothetical protein
MARRAWSPYLKMTLASSSVRRITTAGSRTERHHRRGLHLGKTPSPSLAGRERSRFLVQTCPTRQEITSSAAITPSTTNTTVCEPPPLADDTAPRSRRARMMMPVHGTASDDDIVATLLCEP